MATSPDPGFSLHHNAHGRLVYVGADGVAVEGVVPVRAFPISEPERGLSLLDPEGHELAWIERLADLPEPLRILVLEDLASREFMPRIERIESVSGFSTPSNWQVRTDRGDTSFTLRGEEDIRRLGTHSFLVADSHGIHYLIRDVNELDRHSRKLLDRFL
jgi:hypothetical protein